MRSADQQLLLGDTRKRRNSPIEPILKAWIDHVIVPALVDRWGNREAVKAA